MQFIYLLGINIYGLLLRLVTPFHGKARKWVEGRRGILNRIAKEMEVEHNRQSIWFHFASLGEFEQGRPVLEKLRVLSPDKKIVVTFYSPSGYEIRKNTPLADHVFYLPEDTPSNASKFIRLTNPAMAIFTKYEYWHYYFNILRSNNIPLYMISAIFRPDQIFFRKYGGFFRKSLDCVSHFFTQNEESVSLLAKLGYTNATLAGDTRFDRVVHLPQTRKSIPSIDAFVEGYQVLVAGSTWPADEELLAHLHQKFPGWKMIIAPHEIPESHINSIEKLFPDAIRFSRLTSQISNLKSQILIIDNIGMLSSLYSYGRVAYVGGGFGAGIHNTLEAAAYDIPVIFGSNYHKFQEAKDLIALKAGYPVHDGKGLADVFEYLQDEAKRKTAGEAAGTYVRQNAGATSRIIAHITPKSNGHNF